VLRTPIQNRIFFAAEACSTHDFSTAHGAYKTGSAAAEAYFAQNKSTAR
jgi:monoamine oxidase